VARGERFHLLRRRGNGIARCLPRIKLSPSRPATRSQGLSLSHRGLILMRKRGLEGRRPHSPCRNHAGHGAASSSSARLANKTYPNTFSSARRPDGVAQGERRPGTRTSPDSLCAEDSVADMDSRSLRASMRLSQLGFTRRARDREPTRFAWVFILARQSADSCFRYARSWC